MDLWDSILRMLSALAVVLALMMVVVAIARRVMGTRSGAGADAPLVRVLSTGYLGPKKSISVVSVAGELLIIGTTSTDLIPLGRVSSQAKAKVKAAEKASIGPDDLTRCSVS
jgi:flagellar protein FliO/FliZ